MKRVFTIAGITAVSGLMMATSASGCSSETIQVDQGAVDATPDVTKKPPPDALPPEDTGPATCPPDTEITAAEIEQQVGAWKQPAAVSNVCKQADIDAIKSLFASAKADGGS